jgi:hypothetical protein
MRARELKVLETRAFAGLTPQQLHQQTMSHRRTDPESQLVIALSQTAFLEFMGSAPFVSMLDPEKDFEKVKQGLVGTLLGLPVVTDSYQDKPVLAEGISICYRVTVTH